MFEYIFRLNIKKTIFWIWLDSRTLYAINKNIILKPKMKYLIIFAAINQLFLINAISTLANPENFDILFFENAYFNGKFYFFYYSLRLFIFLFIPIIIYLDEFLLVHSTTNNCQNLPDEWQNRTSSILTNGCVVLYTQYDCILDNKPQIFLSAQLKFYDVYASIPDSIPNYNFYDTW